MQIPKFAWRLLGVSAGDVVVCSTGLIGTGDEVFRGKVLAGVEAGVAQLSADGGPAAQFVHFGEGRGDAGHRQAQQQGVEFRHGLPPSPAFITPFS